MKKILSLILVCVLLLTACVGLVSCGDQQTDDPTVTTDSGSTPGGEDEVSNFPIPDDVLEGHTPTDSKYFKFKVIDEEKATAKVSGFYTDIPEEVVIPAEVEINGKKYTITELGDSALAQSAVKSVYVPYTVTKIGNFAFSGCPNLETVSIPTTVTKIANGLFANCTGLVTVDFIPTSVTSIGERAFEGCKATSIVIPDSVKKIGAFAFVDCGYVDTIVLPSTLEEIPNDCFNGCQYLNNVVLPDSVKVIGKNAFKGCKRMTNFAMGAGVEKVGDSAFADCTNMTKFAFTDSVKSIGTLVFDGNRKLDKVRFPANSELVIADNMFAADTSKFKLKNLYCAAGTPAETWLKDNGYGDRIKDLATYEG